LWSKLNILSLLAHGTWIQIRCRVQGFEGLDPVNNQHFKLALQQIRNEEHHLAETGF